MPSPSQQDSNDKKAAVQHYFARTAESYVTSSSHRGGNDLKRLIELGEWHDQQHALDIATGGGHTALAIAPYVAQVMVTDLTPRMLETAQTFLLSEGVTNAQFQVADAEQLPFPANSFDCVTCRIAPHHFPNRGQFVQEVARVLKSNGLFLLIDCMAPDDAELDTFDNTIEKWRDSSHGRSCTAEEWRKFCEKAHLRVEHTEFFRKTHDYNTWTDRAQLPAAEKTALARFIVESDARIQEYFEVTRRPDGSLQSFSNDFILLKARKI